MASASVKTRILIISDTHCAALSKKEGSPGSYPVPPFESPLPSADLLIHCGDLTHTGEEHQYHQCLDMFSEINAPVKLVIAGNHDLSLDRDFLLSHLKPNETKQDAGTTWQRMRDLWTSPNGRAKREGVTLLDEGLHLVDLPNGASVNVYASPYTPEFCDWGFAYERHEDRYNRRDATLYGAKGIATEPVPNFNVAQREGERKVDVLLTHGPPWQLMDRTETGEYAGCPHLLRALMRSRPLIHCFGHIHEGWGAKRIGWGPQADMFAHSSGHAIDEWKHGGHNGAGWEAGVADKGQAIEALPVDDEKTREEHAAFADVSAAGGNVIERGKETLLVNAAIMDVKYKPVNAPWVVDVDLPRKV